MESTDLSEDTLTLDHETVKTGSEYELVTALQHMQDTMSAGSLEAVKAMADLVTTSAQRKAFKITGSYKLESYDDNLEPWLCSLGIDGKEMGPKFRETRVKIMVREPNKHNRKWSLVHKEEGGTGKSITYDFEPGKSITLESVDGVTERVSCVSSGMDTEEDANSKIINQLVVLCKSEVKAKGWNIESRICFVPEGIKCIVTNKGANVSMSAKYTKLPDPWTLKKRKLLMVKNL